MSQARENRVRKVRIEAPRGDIVDRNGTRAGQDARRAGGADRPRARCPSRCSRRPTSSARQRGVAEKARLAAAAQLRALERDIRERRRGADPQPAARTPPAGPLRPPGATPVPIPPPPADETELRRLYRELGRVINVRPRLIHQRVIEGVAELPYSNVTIKAAVSRAAFNYIRERKERVPRRRGREAVPARLPARRAGRPAVRHHARDLAGRAQAEALPRRRAGHADRRRRHRGELRQVPARQRRLHAGRHQRARQPRRPPAG